MPSVTESGERSLPAPPVLKELPAAIVLSLCSIGAIVLVPLRGIWDSDSGITWLRHFVFTRATDLEIKKGTFCHNHGHGSAHVASSHGD